MKTQATSRLTQVDALRGIAALMVVFFHYTTKYEELFGHTTAPLVSVPWGYLGVNLFFMISGFVIFMTLEKTTRPLDFVISRAARLYPAYWVAVVLTFTITSWTNLPGQTVDLATAIFNLSMLQGLFGIPSVDGVYWTLKIELIFYAWALLLFHIGYLERIQKFVIVLLLLRATEYFLAELGGYVVPSGLSRLLLLDVISWFGAGIAVYKLTGRQLVNSKKSDLLVLLLCALVVGITEGLAMAVLLGAAVICLIGAASGRLKVLSGSMLTNLGALSYCLYLLHENIGWSIIIGLESAGLSADAAILSALSVSLALAFLVMRFVEQPGVKWVREWYRSRRTRQAC